MDTELLKKYYDDYISNKTEYDKAYDYYKGNSNTMKNYVTTDRSNHKVSVNFVKKLCKEEVAYSVGNSITYMSNEGNNSIIRDLRYYTSHWNESNDTDLTKQLVLYGSVYELYYINKSNEICARVINPRSGFHIEDENGDIEYFAHVYKKKFSENILIDLYTSNEIIHCDENFNELGRKPHIFGRVPVGYAALSDEGIKDTLYNDISTLQDAYEANLSDICCEISDTRIAYLTMSGVDELDETQCKEIKSRGIINLPDANAKMEWLVKNINDTFVKNTLDTLEDNIYQISSHVNTNERLQSNLSGTALRSRMVSLEQKCMINQKAIHNLIKNRLSIVFSHIYKLTGNLYDYKDVIVKFTPAIPQDDQAIADIISKVKDILPIDTALSQFSFINNPSKEKEKLYAEQSELNIGSQLLGSQLLGGTNE